VVRQGVSTDEISRRLGVDRRSSSRALNPTLDRAARLLLASPVKFWYTVRPFLDGRLTIGDVRTFMLDPTWRGYTWRQVGFLWDLNLDAMSPRLAEYNVLQALTAMGNKLGALADAGLDAFVETWLPYIEDAQRDIERRAVDVRHRREHA